jgi:hypothetical protein
MLGNRSVVNDLKYTIKNSGLPQYEKAYEYAISNQTSETLLYGDAVDAARAAYAIAYTNYLNTINPIKDAVTYSAYNIDDELITYTGYSVLLEAVNSVDASDKFPDLTTLGVVTTDQMQEALDILAQADADISAVTVPTLTLTTGPGYYFYRLPTITSEGFNISNVDGYPIILIKREGGFASTSSDEYVTTEKLCHIYGYDFGSLRDNILSINSNDIKAAGVLQGVDVFTGTVAGKMYIANFFNAITNSGLTVARTETSWSTAYDGDGNPYSVQDTKVYNPYIKVAEGSINLFVTAVSINKYVVNLSLGTLNPTVSVTKTNDVGKYDIYIVKPISSTQCLKIDVIGFTLQAYVAVDTSYHGTEIGMFTFSPSVATATDNTDPLILPMIRSAYLSLSPLHRIDVSRESGFFMILSGNAVAMTWAQDNMAAIQIVLVVLAVFTAGSSLALAGTATASTAAGAVVTTVTYSMTALLVELAVSTVIVLAVKELAVRMFPDSEVVQVAATVAAVYFTQGGDFSPGAMDKILNDPSFITNMLKASTAVLDVYNEAQAKKIKEKESEYSADLAKLEAEYEANEAELEALPQLTDLIREDYQNSVLLRNKPKPLETVEMFYNRTLNTSLAEVATNPEYYFSSKLNLNNIS